MAIGSDLYSQVTSRIAEILKGDDRLEAGLPSRPEVHGCPFYEIVGPDSLVFVSRARAEALWWMGEQGVDIDSTWQLEAVTRVLGDPETLEERTSILAANLLAIMSDHKLEPGMWVLQSWGPSIPYSVRKDGQHVYELEWFPVGVRLYGIDL